MKNDTHLLDFLSYPLRIQESDEIDMEGVLKVDYPFEEMWQQSIYQKMWLEYAFRWIRQHDPVGHLQMPVTRVVVDGVSERRKYKANIKSDACKQGTQVWKKK